MRLVFAGTPEAAVPALRLLAGTRHEIALVVTRPDAPRGRKRVVTPSAVAQAAAELGLPVLKTARLDEAATAAITATGPELGVIVAYGGLVREPLLSAPDHGWINLHFSLLPRWRGAAPVQRALIAGDEETGASVFRLVADLDAGDVFGRTRFRVPGGATAADVLTDLAGVGAALLREVVDGIAAGTARAEPQTGEPTLAPKLTIADGALDFTQPAALVLARLRGVTPEPGAFTTVGGVRVKILEAAEADAAGAAAGGDAAARPAATEILLEGRRLLVGTATTPVELLRVQPAGKGPMTAADWWRGARADHPRTGS